MKPNQERTLRNLSINLNNLLRYGTISDVDAEKAKIRVQSGDIKTPWTSWVNLMSGDDKSWRVPTIGEYALILSPGGNFSLAIALVGIYYDKFPAPENNSDIHSVTYSDGTKISYDKKQKEMSVNCVGSVLVKAKESVSVETQGSVILNANEINLGGNIPVARVGDLVEVQITSGSSAGTYSGKITSGSGKVKAG